MDPVNPSQPTVPSGEPAARPQANPSAPTNPGSDTGDASIVAAQVSSRPGPALDAGLNAEIDEAMAALGLGPSNRAGGGGGGGGGSGQRKGRPQPQPRPEHNVAPIGGPARAALKGPRVVQAGREHRTGTVVSVGPSDLFLEFGPKELGVAPRTQWPDEDLPAVGSQVEVVVDRFEAAESLYICSRPGTVVKAAWENLDVGQTVDAKVVGVNKGGLELEVGGHRAFMPASQVSLDRIPDLSVFIGEKMTCQVSQIDKRGRGNIVLSRRDLLEVERREKAGKLRDTLNEGDVLEGTVRKIMPFGAFVDLGGVDGLVHISDISYDRTGFGEQAVQKHLKEGQAVKVKVLKVEWDEADPKKSRISLGIKQLAGDPFTTAANQITEGAEVTGRVTRLADFGAFVEVAPGVEGLVHVSEIAYRRVNHPQDELKPDQVVQAKVLKIDPGTRRISLSIKATQPAPAAPAGKGGKGGKGDRFQGRTQEEIQKETPALRRLRAQAALRAKNQQLKGGF